MSFKEIDVLEFQKMREEKIPHLLLDVREKEEVDIACIKLHVHIALQDIPSHYTQLDKTLPIVVMCHRGGRSRVACQFLYEKGLEVINLKGGIDAWSKKIDPSIPLY